MTKTYEYTMLRRSFHVQYYFKKPTFRWPEMAARFFEMLSGAFGSSDFNLQTAELTTNASQNFSELRARYSVFGGATSVSLLPDRIAFDFPGLSAVDLPLVRQILEIVHDEFIKAFSEVTFGRLEVQDFAHLDLGKQEAVSTVLEKYRLSELGIVFGDSIVVTPSARFSIASNDGSWRAVAMLEPSQQTTTALFSSLSVTLLKVPPALPYHEKAGLVQSIIERCLKALHLEEAKNAS